MLSSTESNKPKSRNSSALTLFNTNNINKYNSEFQNTTGQQVNKRKRRGRGRSETNKNEKEEAKQSRAKRQTKTIRHLIVERRSNLEIQSLLQLSEYTFYRHMTKINEIDQALFVEQEKETFLSTMGSKSVNTLNSHIISNGLEETPHHYHVCM